MTDTTAQTEVQTPLAGSVGHADGVLDELGASTPEDAPEGSRDDRKEARFRQERNEARDERDALAVRVERYHRAEIERLAADAGLAMGTDLFVNGNGVADYLTEDGDVDADAVAADVAAVLAERPRLGKNAPAHDPSLGLGGGKAKHQPSWNDLFKH